VQPLEDVSVTIDSRRHLRPGKLSLRAAAENALERAAQYDGTLPESVLSMVGMSGRKYRLFINNLIGSISGPRYLEVGSWAGSTLCSAIHGNDVTAVAIDNWSEFDGPSNLFFGALAQSVSSSTRVSVINRDFRQLNYASLGRFNVYLFDGPHAAQDQYDGIAMALDALDHEFIFIVDDWNWSYVREGTYAALADLNLAVDWSAEVRTTQDDTHPAIKQQDSDWHNGYFVGLIRR
jgi:hypothetical protein